MYYGTTDRAVPWKVSCQERHNPDDSVDIPDTIIADSARQGSTKLHLDMSGAVNIMVVDIADRGSLWTIFAAEDADPIRRYLRRKHSLPSSSPCPIHSQNYFLGPIDLRTLFVEENVVPYIFTQKKGQAVFIPVGCPHQVKHSVIRPSVLSQYECSRLAITAHALK